MSKTIKNADVYTLARSIKATVEKSRTIGDNKVNGVTYTYPESAYILSYALNNLSSDITVPSVKKPSNWTGDTLDENIYPSDWKDQAKRIVQYIKQNGQCPNWVTTVKSKKRASAWMFIYAFAKILVWYKDHNNTLPNYCTYKTAVFYAPSTKKKYGHATKSGCDNMGQNNGYYCGCHSLQEVFRNLTGIVVKQSTIASWAGTTSSGTGHDGLNTAVAKFNKTYNKNLKVEWKNFSDLGWNGIANIVKSKNQDCVIHNLYRRNGEKGYGHYETVNSVSTNVNVQNSLGDKCSNGCYCGYIEYRSQSTFTYYINGISQKSVMVITNA